MATYYVRTTGNDANAGTATSAAWLTVGKAMTTLTAADICYVGAGTYRITSALVPTNSGSSGSAISLLGDTDGSKTGDAGEVIVTNFGTNDSTAATAIHIFDFSAKAYWTVGSMSLAQGVPGSYFGVNLGTTANNITLQDLTIWSAGYGIWGTTATWNTVQAHTIKRCRIAAVSGGVGIGAPGNATGSNVNLNVLIANCVIVTAGGQALTVYNGGSITQRSGGVTMSNCLAFGSDSSGGGLIINSAGNATSTTYPINVYNCLVVGTVGIKSVGTGQIVEDYNVIVSGTPRTNVTAGSSSKSDNSRNPRFSLGHEPSFGGAVRSWGEPPSGSPLLTFGGTSVPADDINGITRPSSGAGQTTTQQALGPFERSNSATKETTTTRTGGTAIKIAGPGYHDFELAVSPVSTNVVVWSYKDSTYGTAATGPQLIITNAGEAGYGGTTITSAGGTGAWAAMTATFTPSSAGIVTVRLQSNATVGSAAAYFDDFSVT